MAQIYLPGVWKNLDEVLQTKYQTIEKRAGEKMKEKKAPPRKVWIYEEIRNPIDGYWCSKNIWGKKGVEYIKKEDKKTK